MGPLLFVPCSSPLVQMRRKPQMHTVSPSESAMRLVNFLAEREACSLRKAKALLDARVVFVNGKRVWMAKHTLRAGDRVEIQ